MTEAFVSEPSHTELQKRNRSNSKSNSRDKKQLKTDEVSKVQITEAFVSEPPQIEELKQLLVQKYCERSFEKLLGNRDFFLLYIFFMNTIMCNENTEINPYDNLQKLFNSIIAYDDDINASMQYVQFYLSYNLKQINNKINDLKQNGLTNLGYSNLGYSEFFEGLNQDENNNVGELIEKNILYILQHIKNDIEQKHVMINIVKEGDDSQLGGKNKSKNETKSKMEATKSKSRYKTKSKAETKPKLQTNTKTKETKNKNKNENENSLCVIQ